MKDKLIQWAEDAYNNESDDTTITISTSNQEIVITDFGTSDAIVDCDLVEKIAEAILIYYN